MRPARHDSKRNTEKMCNTVIWCSIALIYRGAAGIVFELGVLPEKGQAHRTDRTVTLLADDDLGRALVRRIRIVNFVAVDEQDDVGILLDGARFAQIGHHRAL